jgi:hypothetical protein
MLFKYTVSLEVEVEFEAPLLGADTTKPKRKITNEIAKKALQEMIKLGSSFVLIDREVEEENLNGTVKGSINLCKSEKNKY